MELDLKEYYANLPPPIYIGDLDRLPKLCGVYQIWNNFNMKLYIGSSLYSIHRRIKNHVRELRGGYHRNTRLQEHWEEHGERWFSFRVVELCDPETVLDREHYWIQRYSCGGQDRRAVYNTMFGRRKPPSRKGIPHSTETKELISERLKDPKIYARLVAARRARGPASEETKAKMSAAHKGKTFSPETRAKLSAARIATATRKREERANAEQKSCDSLWD